MLTVFSREPTDPDYPGSSSSFTTERNLDTKRPKKRLRATQVAGEGAGIFRPTGAVPRDTITAAVNADPQKICSATRPGAALAHELPHASGDRVRVDNALDRGRAVGCIGARESTGGPEAGLAGDAIYAVAKSCRPKQSAGTRIQAIARARSPHNHRHFPLLFARGRHRDVGNF